MEYDRLRDARYGRVDHDRVLNRAHCHRRRRDAVGVRHGWLRTERSAIGWDRTPSDRHILYRLSVRAEQRHRERKVEGHIGRRDLAVPGDTGDRRGARPAGSTGIAAT